MVLGDKESPTVQETQGSIPGAGRSPGARNGSPLQYSCLGNPMDRGAWRATVLGVAEESDTTEHTGACIGFIKAMVGFCTVFLSGIRGLQA